MTKVPYLVLAGIAALSLTACNQNPNSAERTGEAMDTQSEKAMGQPVDLTDGPMENAGEAIDDAAHNTAETTSEATAAAKAKMEATGAAIKEKAAEVKEDMKDDTQH